MIKVCKGLYVHFTIVLLVLLCWFNRNLETLAISYLAVFLHELTHLFAALLIGLKPSHIVLFPFGTNLKLKNKITFALSDEIILYMAGPVFNALAALVFLPFIGKNPYFNLFYCNNIGLFIFNILPILPMDGGVVFKKILSHRVGQRQAELLLKIISVVLIGVLILFQAYILIKSEFNFFILFATVFLTGNLFTNKEKYYSDFTKELMYYKRKDEHKIKKVSGYVIRPDTDLKKLVKHFSFGKHYLIFKENTNGSIDKILTEREVVEELLK